MPKPSLSPIDTHYYFSHVKDTHAENGQMSITLFARLTIETPERSDCVWVGLEEVVWNQAAREL
ncbi:hypothetical protein [Planococcus lenghuensis]|uniref:hypothetical protein n=1 Tax=Planococcus lenghuensis TaxID=2213202 RepID=UPI0012EC5CDC|nr:hypothetical protein [Planococcus lenghuensis]